MERRELASHGKHPAKDRNDLLKLWAKKRRKKKGTARRELIFYGSERGNRTAIFKTFKRMARGRKKGEEHLCGSSPLRTERIPQLRTGVLFGKKGSTVITLALVCFLEIGKKPGESIRRAGDSSSDINLKKKKQTARRSILCLPPEGEGETRLPSGKPGILLSLNRRVLPKRKRKRSIGFLSL